MAPEDLDRDKMYTADADDFESDAELELEPPDPDVLASEQRRAEEAINVHRKAININEVYDDLDANRDTQIVNEWLDRWKGYRFQFQIRHLLILTAVVAIILSLGHWMYLGTVFIVGIMLAVAGVSLYLKVEENKRQEAADRRRQQMYAQRRAAQAGKTIKPQVIETVDVAPTTSPEVESYWLKPVRDFRFQFSLSQLLIAITVAALLLGLGASINGTAGLATVFGLVALAGLLIPVFGLRPPDTVILGWWVVLVLYVVLSLFSAIWASVTGP